jgi:hypothetical protein
VQVQGVLLEKHRVAKQEKISLQTMFDEEKAQMQQEKEQFLAGKLKVKEAVNRSLRFVTGCETQEKEWVEHQVEYLMEAIQ